MSDIAIRVDEPTRGFAEINGRVGSLLEVGTGFHPELIGRGSIFTDDGEISEEKTLECG